MEHGVKMYNSYIICLSKIESSLTTALALKKQLEDFNMPVELFEGTYGNDAVDLVKNENRIYCTDTYDTIEEALRWEKKSSYPGVLGCFYSHYRLWQHCVALNEPIIVWEDDVVIKQPFVDVEWDEVLVLSLGFEELSQPYLHLLNNNNNPQALQYVEQHVPGTTGYAITPLGASKLLDKYRNTFAPSDIAMNKKVINIQIHSNVMGQAIVDKLSLVRNLKFWKK